MRAVSIDRSDSRANGVTASPESFFGEVVRAFESAEREMEGPVDHFFNIGGYHVRLRFAGPAAARNVGLRVASGEVVAFIDADDLWPERKLALQMARFEENPCVHGTNLSSSVTANNADLLALLRDSIRRQHTSKEDTVAGVQKKEWACMKGVSVIIPAYNEERYIAVALESVSGQSRQVAEIIEAGLQSIMLPQVVMLRRLHATNLVLREKQSQTEYARILKASLERKRAARGTEKHA